MNYPTCILKIWHEIRTRYATPYCTFLGISSSVLRFLFNHISYALMIYLLLLIVV